MGSSESLYRSNFLSDSSVQKETSTRLRGRELQDRHQTKSCESKFEFINGVEAEH